MGSATCLDYIKRFVDRFKTLLGKYWDHIYAQKDSSWLLGTLQYTLCPKKVHLFVFQITLSNCYSLTHHTWKMSPHYLVKCTHFSSFSFFHVYWVPIRDMDELRKRYDMGWILAEHGGWCSWSVAQKTGSMYLCRRWSLWTFAVMLHAWHSICHTSQPVLFRATNANPQLAFSEPPTFGGMQHAFSHMKKLCILQGNVVTFFRCGG